MEVCLQHSLQRLGTQQGHSDLRLAITGMRSRDYDMMPRMAYAWPEFHLRFLYRIIPLRCPGVHASFIDSLK